ncbi:unnamed protein product [Enterobius vermicularis]|uniref:Multidrug resistance-associated protein 5 n=1 Tax=Enterobius vermicularis TaxID=51028 RepID=A0A0N4VE61_ENTVE|nr:unnamed protein product [Enterobius vermicularis]
MDLPTALRKGSDDGDEEEDVEVYRGRAIRGEETTGFPEVRYARGKKEPKNFSRYKQSLRNALLVRRGTKSSEPNTARVDESGLFSFVTYTWIFPYLWAAFRGRLSHNQTWNCSIYDSSTVNLARIEYLWNQELARRPENPSLFRVVWVFMRTRVIIACLIFLFCLTFGFVGPTCLVRRLISFVESPDMKGKPDSLSYGMLCVFALLFVEFSRVLSYGGTWAVSYRTAIRARGALLAFLYKKLINVRTLRKKTAAEIVNVFANDSQRIFDAVTFVPLVLMGPLVIVGGIIYLIALIGIWSFLGFLVFFVFDVFQFILGKTMIKFRSSAIQKTEKRVSVTGEIVRCIRAIKVNCWEDSFQKTVEAMRHNEKVDLRKAGLAQSLAIASGPIVPAVAATATFIAVIFSGHDLLASDAFSAITVFFVMLFGVRMIPYGSRYCAESIVALRRIQALLLYPPYDDQIPQPKESGMAVCLKDAVFSWDAEVSVADSPKEGLVEGEDKGASAFQLRVADLKIRKKELIGITGTVGSGKSALLDAISGHIGERGVTLSGGQKARISLARALFSNSQVYLIDNILCSVDQNVSDRIFKSAIREVLGNKTVLFVTNNIQYLSQCDRVVHMEGGQVVGVGSHQELLEKSEPYAQFCESCVTSVQENRLRFEDDQSMKITDDDFVKVESSKSGGAKILKPRSGSFPSEISASTVGSLADIPLATNGRIVEEEENYGLAAVKWSIYRKYIEAAGSIFTWIVLSIAFLLNVIATIFSTAWLAQWLKNGRIETNITVGNDTLVTTRTLVNSPANAYYGTICGFSILFLGVSGLVKAIIFVQVSLNAASKLHNKMFRSILRANVQFFDTTPTGRILNRFSKDMDEIDIKLPFSAEVFLQNGITCICYLIMIIWVFPWFIPASIPLACCFSLFVVCFRAGITSLKRIENVSRSPLFDHITASMEGLYTIHSLGQINRFVDTLKTNLDANSGAMFMYQSAMRWLAVWLDLIVVAITFVVGLLIVMFTGRVSPADAGMALAFAVQMSGIFQFAVRTHTDLEAKMTCVERVAYYSEHVESESDVEGKNERTSVPNDWPSNGKIAFSDVKLRYRLNLPLALDGVSFVIDPKDKIGVVGRTGSGKSSLYNALYRLYSLTWGTISIDGVNIAHVPLHRLRRSMAVIPQDPALFAGTIRYNLDPEKEFGDNQLWDALEKAHAKDIVMALDRKMDSAVEEGGRNFSVGERQLLCMARAILRKAKIVILDEATSSLDSSLDKKIQDCLSEALADSTVILIAHRLENVLRLDKILYMDQAKVLEYGKISELLDNKDSNLSRLLSEQKITPVMKQMSLLHQESNGKDSSITGSGSSTPVRIYPQIDDGSGKTSPETSEFEKISESAVKDNATSSEESDLEIIENPVPPKRKR